MTTSTRKVRDGLLHRHPQRRTPVLVIMGIIMACANPSHALTSNCNDTELGVAGLRESAQKAFDAAIAASGAPGGVASVMLPNGKCFALASGVADRDRGFAMTIDHRFAGGSISKQFIGALIVKAKLDGKLGLDDPISKYVGDKWWFKYLVNGDRISVRMLLAHTAGLADLPWETLTTHPAYRDAVYGPNEDYATTLMETGWFNLPAEHEPGGKFSYSDTHYVMLAFILEAIDKERFELQVHRFLYRMGMMFTEPDGMAPMSGMAKGYFGTNGVYDYKTLAAFGASPIDDGVFKLIYSQAHGGGWVVTSPRDLAFWTWQWFSGRLLTGDYVSDLTKETFPWKETAARVGLANTFLTQNTSVGPELGGSGFDYGFGTYTAYYPKYDVAIAVQINTNLDAGVRPILFKLAEEVLTSPLPKAEP